jgi:hypothetical protein
MRKNISQAQKKKVASERSPRHSISESKLRRMIRDELARQYLMEEGVFDNLKKPFQKLGEKAKKYIIEKTDELLPKISKLSKNLKSDESIDRFFKDLEKEKNGKSFEELVSSVPEYAKLKKQADELKDFDFKQILKSPQVSEGLSLHDLRMSVILEEEKLNQKKETGVIAESVVAAAAAAWWGTVKLVVGSCGLITFMCKFASKACDHMGFKKAASVLDKIYHFVEHVEEFFLDKIAFPKPIQYAAFRVMWATKYAHKGEPLSYEKFMSEEGKEERETTIKHLHTAVICFLVIDAFHHIVDGVGHFFHALKESISEMIHTGSHTAEKIAHGGVEATNLIKKASSAIKAGESMAGAVGDLAGAQSISA